MEYRRLQLARKAAMAVAGIAFVLLLLTLTGTKAHPVTSIAALVIWLAGMIAEAVLRRRINKHLKAEQEKKPMRTVSATVESRRITHRINGSGRFSSSSGRDAWFVTFQTAQSERLEFETPYDVYEKLREGMSGTLRYRGWAFVSFKGQ